MCLLSLCRPDSKRLQRRSHILYFFCSHWYLLEFFYQTPSQPKKVLWKMCWVFNATGILCCWHTDAEIWQMMFLWPQDQLALGRSQSPVSLAVRDRPTPSNTVPNRENHKSERIKEVSLLSLIEKTIKHSFYKNTGWSSSGEVEMTRLLCDAAEWSYSLVTAWTVWLALTSAKV